MKYQNRSAGLIYGSDAHHLDHIALVCKILNIPLIVTDEAIAASAGKFYPDLEVIVWEYLELPENLVGGFEIIFSSLPRLLFDEVFFFAQNFLGKRVHTIWVPHGCSDKGAKSPFFEALSREEMALLYGRKMEEQLDQKQVLTRLKGFVLTGNYRYQFYLENQPFYDALVEEKIWSVMKPNQKRVLYAPTWQDSEGSSTFFEACALVAERLSKKYNLIVKVHPNLLLQDEWRSRQLMEAIQKKQEVLFLIDFPPIYPLLKGIDLYIGDMSSIGYDFLLFDRPLFFLSEKSSFETPLFQCGIVLHEEQYGEIDHIIGEHLSSRHPELSQRRQKLYDFSFGATKNLPLLLQEINEMIERVIDDEFLSV